MGVVSRVAVELTTGPAVAAARKLQGGVDRLRGELDRIPPVNRRVAASFRLAGKQGISALRDLESNANRVAKSIGGLRGVVGKTVIAFAAFKAAQAGIARAESERRIKLLGQRFGEVAQLQAVAAQSAKKFNLSQTEANQAIANTFARLRPLGVSLEDITSTFNGFRTAAVLGGATAAEASASFTQLSQALGSGALRGDEFRSVSEQAPLVLQAISDETGIAAGSLKEYAAEGLLTSDIVIKALKRIESEGAGRLEQALSGPAAKIKEFQNASEEVQVALTETVIPELSKSFVILADIIKDLKPVIQSVGSFAASVLGGINETIQRIRDPSKLAAEQQAFFAEGRMKAAMKGGQRGLANLPADYAKQEAALFAAAGAPSVTPSAPIGTSPIKPLPGKSSEAEDLLSKQLKSGAELSKQFQRQIELKQASTDLLREELQIEFDRQDALANIAETAELGQQADLNALANKIALLETEEARTENAEKLAKIQKKADKDAADAAKRRLETDPGYRMQQQLEKLLDTQNQAAFAAESMGSAFADAFGDVVTGAKTGQEALADMLKSIASDFLAMAKKIIAQQLAMILYGTIMRALGIGGGFNSPAASPGGSAGVAGIGGGGLGDVFGNTSSFGTFADGGFVNKPTNALIGEGGEPEYVVPASKMNEAMGRYARGARGAAVIPDRSGGDAGGEMGGGGGSIDVTYSVERINNINYVTAAEFEKGMAQAAKRGAELGKRGVYSDLINKRSVRSRVGV